MLETARRWHKDKDVFEAECSGIVLVYTLNFSGSSRFQEVITIPGCHSDFRVSIRFYVVIPTTWCHSDSVIHPFFRGSCRIHDVIPSLRGQYWLEGINIDARVIIDSRGLSLTPEVIIDSRELSLTPGGYHWLQKLSLTPGGYHWLQGVIIVSRELSLTPGGYHRLQGAIIDSRGLSLTPGGYHWLIMFFFKNRDSLEYLCEGYPGFITKFKAAAGPEDPKASHTDTVDFENYRHVCHKWHYKVRKFSRMYFY